MPQFQTNVEGAPASISYADLGDGPAIVLVHGFPIDGRIWDDVVPQLMAGHRVIVPDLPGFGRSTFAAPAFTMQSQAGALVALLDHAGVDRAVFAGLSMGGYVLQALVRNWPERVRGLSFVDSKAAADDAAGRAGRDKMIALIHEKGTAGVVEQMLPKMLGPRTLADAALTVIRQESIMLNQSPRTLIAACAAMRDREDFTPYLASLPCPLQIIVGDADVIAPPEVAQAMHEQAPGSRLDIIPDAGHMSPIERPADVARVLREFLAEMKKAD